MRRIAPLLLAALVLVTALAPAVSAQTPTPNEINAVARELWCPLCNGVRLDNCDLQACIQMREVIAQKLEAGEDLEQIKAYFVQQYGDVVLGAPDASGFNLVVWLFPLLAVAVGIGWLVYFISGARRRASRAPAAAPGGAPRPTGHADLAAADPYLSQVERELENSD
jgi:cytochrome c-type biogenesis protein CcmH